MWCNMGGGGMGELYDSFMSSKIMCLKTHINFPQTHILVLHFCYLLHTHLQISQKCKCQRSLTRRLHSPKSGHLKYIYLERCYKGHISTKLIWSGLSRSWNPKHVVLRAGLHCGPWKKAFFNGPSSWSNFQGPIS